MQTIPCPISSWISQPMTMRPKPIMLRWSTQAVPPGPLDASLTPPNLLSQDGGDPAVPAVPRDIVYTLDAGDAGAAPRQLVSTNLRCGGMVWGDDDLALVGSPGHARCWCGVRGSVCVCGLMLWRFRVPGGA